MSERIVALALCKVSDELIKTFKEADVYVAFELNHLTEDDISFIIIDENVEKIEYDKPAFHVGTPSDIGKFLSRSARSVIHPELFKSKLGRTFIKRALGEDSSISFENAYTSVEGIANSLKIVDYNSIGYYSDVITTEANNHEFSEISVRNFYNGVISYYYYLSKSSVVDFTVDVDFGVTEDAFIMQTHVTYDDIGSEFISDSFQNMNNINPFKGLLQICSKYSDILDIYLLENSNKFVVTGVWFKDSFYNLQAENYCSSIFFGKIDSYKNKTLTKTASDIKPVLKVKPSDFKENDRLKDQVKENIFSSGRHLSIVKLAANFVNDVRENESIESRKDSSQLSKEDIKKYLEDFPSESMRNELDEDDLHLVQKVVQDPDYFRRIVSDLENVPKKVDGGKFVSNILDKVKRLSQDDIDEVFRVRGFGLGNTKDEVTKVAGGHLEGEEHTVIENTTENITEKTTLIEGDHSETHDVEKRVENTTEHRSTVWVEKRSEVITDIETLLREDEEDIPHLAIPVQKISSVFIDKLGLRPEEGQALAEYIGDYAAESFLHVLALDDSQKLRNMAESLEVREHQILKMKKIIDKLKVEVQSDQFNKSLASEVLGEVNATDDEKEKIIQLEASLRKLVHDYTEKDLALKKMLSENDNKNREIAHLENQMERIGKKHEEQLNAITKEIVAAVDMDKPTDEVNSQVNEEAIPENSEEMNDLMRENELLKNKVKTSNERVTNISGNLDDMKNKSSDEVVKLKKQNLMAQTALNKFKQENADLKTKLEALMRNAFGEEAQPGDQEIIAAAGGGAPLKVANNDEAGESKLVLTAQLKEAQDNVKKSGIRIKKLEQRTKALQEQVELLAKAAKKKGGAAKSSQNDSALTLKMKQMEVLNSKLVDANNKNAKDLADRKKALHQLKTESTLMKKELEEALRKLAKYEKNAA